MESGSYTKLGRFVAKPMSFCPCGGCQSISNYCQSLTQNRFTLPGLNHQNNEHRMTDDFGKTETSGSVILSWKKSMTWTKHSA